MTPEGLVKKEVYSALLLLESTSYIYWFERLNSLEIHQPGLHIKGCRKGTPDFIALFKSRDGSLAFAFIECKRNDIVAKWVGTQLDFKNRYEGKHDNLYFWLVQSGSEASHLILKHAYSRLKDIDF